MLKKNRLLQGLQRALRVPMSCACRSSGSSTMAVLLACGLLMVIGLTACSASPQEIAELSATPAGGDMAAVSADTSGMNSHMSAGLAAARPALPDIEHRIDSRTTAFTQNIAGLAQQELPEASIAISGPLQLAVKMQDRDFTWYLDNLWLEVQNAPAAQSELSRQHLSTLRSMMEQPSLTELHRDARTVVPVMKSGRDVDQLNLLMEKNGGVVSEQMAEDLYIVYANDTEHTLAYLSGEEFDRLKIPRNQLRSIAARNLERLLPAAEKESRGDLHRIVAGGNFEASILLIDDAWAAETRSVQGEIVVAVPTRDVILYTGSENEEGLRELQETVDQLYNAGTYSISPHLYVRRNGNWVRF